MNSRRYVICDIEASGLHEEKEIIEIALITFQDGKVTDVYETLVNPLVNISDYISDLTSISQRQLLEAPKFYEIAESIRLRLEGSVFVSHNTDFDYQLLRNKFQQMGQELRLKTFCTLKVAQLEIPGLKSYALDALCSFFGIKNKNRHRAIGDAEATLELFKELFQLRLKNYPKVLYLPHHEKAISKLSNRAGLITLKDAKGKIILYEAAYNMEKRARELLEVKPESRDLLKQTEFVEGESTGSPLIAQFKKLLYRPYTPHWVVVTETDTHGEQYFRVRPYKRGIEALWYFREYFDAKKKVKELEGQLKGEKFIFRDGGKSKEEVLRHNQKVLNLARGARFPTENLIILGEGRMSGERSLILVRNGHVLGYGHTEACEAEILESPESFITRRFFQHLGADLATKRYILELKNMRHKTDGWRSLAEVR